jgi:hypothetical protein
MCACRREMPAQSRLAILNFDTEADAFAIANQS